MDVVLFNEAARKIFLEHLPANTINERFGEVVLAGCFRKEDSRVRYDRRWVGAGVSFHVVFAIKRKLTFHSKEVPFLQTNGSGGRFRL